METGNDESRGEHGNSPCPESWFAVAVVSVEEESSLVDDLSSSDCGGEAPLLAAGERL